MLKKLLFILFFACCAVSSMADTLRIVEPFRMIEHASVLASYRNEFGSYRKPNMDVEFPYALIRVHIEGNKEAVTQAKEQFALYLGQHYTTKVKNTNHVNEIMFLVPVGAGHVELQCGDGCQPLVLFDNPRLTADAIYEGKVRYALAKLGPTPTPNPRKQIFSFEVNPKNASVEVIVGEKSEYCKIEDDIQSITLNHGTYQYKVSAPRYQTETGIIQVSDSMRTKSVQLLPDYGWLTLSATESNRGASAYVINTTTKERIALGNIPLASYELDRGEYLLQIFQNKYKDFTKKITILPNQTIKESPILEPNFISLTLSTDADSEILVNGESFGKGQWSGTLELGEYTVETRKTNHRSSYIPLTLTHAEAAQTIRLASPTPICGSLTVSGSPAKAAIYIDDKYVGESPMIVNDLLIGEHKVRVEKEECSKYDTSIVIKEHHEERITYKLEKGFVVENFEAEGFNTQNVRVHLDKSQFVFTYDLQEKAPIYLLMAVNGSKDYQYVCGAEGAIGENIMPGTNLQITWNPLKFNEQFIVQNVRFRIEAHFKFPNKKVLIGDFYYRATKDGTSVELVPKSRIYGKNYDLSKYTTKDYSPIRIPEYVSYKGIRYWVTRIADYAFNGRSIDREIDIPETIKSIGDYAFWASGIEGIHTSNSVEDLGHLCFGAIHHGLSTVIIGKNVHEIKPNAFGYTQLDELSVHPENITYDSRDNCNAIIESYANKLIKGSSATSIPQSVTSIGSNAFIYMDTLSEIIIPDGVTRIEDDAFWGCDRLHSISIPNSVHTIGSFAFYACDSLTTISIGNNVTKMGYYPFHNTLWYKNQPNGPVYIDGILYAYKGDMPKNAHVNIKSGTRFIGPDAFSRSKNLKSITVPNTVNLIAGGALDGTQWYKKQSDGLVYINDILYEYKGKIPKNTSIQIKNGTKSISSYAFNGCANLNAINIPNSVVHIGNTAFQGCKNLTAITLPSSISAIEDYTFSGCSKLSTIVIPNTVKRIGICAFANCNNLTELHIPEGVDMIEERAFLSCDSLNCITIPSTVTSIGRGISWWCCNLKFIVVEDGNPVFDSRDNCNAIIHSRTNTLIVGCSNTVIPNSVKHIGNYAFNGCDKMTSIVIPNNIESVGCSPFINCSSLKTIYIPRGTKAKFAAMEGLKDHVGKLVER